MAGYLGNTNTKEVHDLGNQQFNCHINQIKPEHQRLFASPAAAHGAGFDNCHWCLGNSKR